MTYRERRERKVERLREWAGKREVKAAAAFDRSHQIADMIPFGQPILRGHHSQRHAERDQERIHSSASRGLEHSRKAAEMSSRAGNIESALRHSIYSDDADAEAALTARISGLESERDRIKRYNESARKGSPDESLLDEKQRAGLDSVRKHAAYQLGKNGSFPAYALANINGAISKNRQRLEAMPKAAPPDPDPDPDDDPDPGGSYTDEEKEALNSDFSGHGGAASGSLWPAIRAHVGGIRITNRQTGRKDYDRDIIPGGLARVKATADYPDRLGEKLIHVYGSQAADWDADTALDHIRREYDAYKELPTKVRLRLVRGPQTDQDRAAARQHRHLRHLDAAIDRERQRHRLRHAAHRRAIAFYTDEEGTVHPITVAA